jgi:hypothetical protein
MSMNTCLDAVEREQRAWHALEGRLPGMPGCSPALWAEWVDATAELNAEVARYTRVEEVPQLAKERRRKGPARAA